MRPAGSPQARPLHTFARPSAVSIAPADTVLTIDTSGYWLVALLAPLHPCARRATTPCSPLLAPCTLVLTWAHARDVARTNVLLALLRDCQRWRLHRRLLLRLLRSKRGEELRLVLRERLRVRTLRGLDVAEAADAARLSPRLGTVACRLGTVR